MLRQTFHPLAPFVALSKTVPEIALRRCSPSTCLLPLLAVWTINKLLSTLCFLYDFFKRPGEIFIQELAADEQSRLYCSFRHFLLRVKSLSFPLNRLFLVFWKRTRKDSRASYLLQPAPVQTTGMEGDCQCIRSLLEKRLAHEWGLTLKTKSTVLARCPSCLGHLAGLQTGGKSLCAGRNPSHLLPPSGEPESWAVGKLCAPLSLHSRAPQEHQESRGTPLFSCCCCLRGALWEKKGLCDCCTRTSSVSSVLLAAPLQNYLNRNQSTLDSEGFSFNSALKEEESDFAKHPWEYTPSEGRSWDHRAVSILRVLYILCSWFDLQNWPQGFQWNCSHR